MPIPRRGIDQEVIVMDIATRFPQKTYAEVFAEAERYYGDELDEISSSCCLFVEDTREQHTKDCN